MYQGKSYSDILNKLYYAVNNVLIFKVFQRDADLVSITSLIFTTFVKKLITHWILGYQ